MKIGIFYGSTMGDTAGVAEQLATAFEVTATPISEGLGSVGELDVLLLGSSTWGYGDLQDEWEGALADLESLDLSGKKVAVFGTGDQESYDETFCSAIGTIAKTAETTGATIIGKTSKEGYNFNDSGALEGDHLIGLAIDVNNQSDLTEKRVEDWVAQLKGEF